MDSPPPEWSPSPAPRVFAETRLRACPLSARSRWSGHRVTSGAAQWTIDGRRRQSWQSCCASSWPAHRLRRCGRKPRLFSVALIAAAHGSRASTMSSQRKREQRNNANRWLQYTTGVTTMLDFGYRGRGPMTTDGPNSDGDYDCCGEEVGWIVKIIPKNGRLWERLAFSHRRSRATRETQALEPLAFAEILPNGAVQSSETGFHCWVQVDGWAIDFSAPLLNEYRSRQLLLSRVVVDFVRTDPGRRLQRWVPCRRNTSVRRASRGTRA